MRKHLTKVEELDAQRPGLADQVRAWFAQGVSARKIPELVLAHFQVAVNATAVSSFRFRRWVPEQALVREKRLSALAALQVAREQEMKAALARKVPVPAVDQVK